MPDGLDYVYRLMLSTPPLANYKQLTDGTYSLADVAEMNEILDVSQENTRRMIASRREV